MARLHARRPVFPAHHRERYAAPPMVSTRSRGSAPSSLPWRGEGLCFEKPTSLALAGVGLRSADVLARTSITSQSGSTTGRSGRQLDPRAPRSGRVSERNALRTSSRTARWPFLANITEASGRRSVDVSASPWKQKRDDSTTISPGAVFEQPRDVVGVESRIAVRCGRDHDPGKALPLDGLPERMGVGSRALVIRSQTECRPLSWSAGSARERRRPADRRSARGGARPRPAARSVAALRTSRSRSHQHLARTLRR